MHEVTEEPQKRGGIRFDATINLGHILTFVGFLLAGFGAWSSLDKRLTVIEEHRYLQKQVDLSQDNRATEAALQMRDVLGRLDKQVERLNDKLDRVVDKRAL
jgi:hypothetical protein